MGRSGASCENALAGGGFTLGAVAARELAHSIDVRGSFTVKGYTRLGRNFARGCLTAELS